MKLQSKDSLELPAIKIRIIQLFSFIALGLSSFLLYGAFSGDQLPGCGIESGCKTVMHSRWSQIFGVPVSLPALILYACVLLGSSFINSFQSPVIQRRIWVGLIIIASALIGAAIWFIGLQLLVIQAICPYCMIAHLIGFLIGSFLLSWAPWSHSQHKLAGSGLRFVFTGIGMVMLMVIAQTIYTPPTYHVQPIPSAGLIRSEKVTQPLTNNANVSGISNPSNIIESANKIIKTRKFEFHNGAFSVDLNEVPLLGSAEAPYIMVQLYDYSCRMCRMLHPALSTVVNDLSNQIAVVCLPVPFATNCNPVIKRFMPEHIDACAYAQIGLAIWRTNRAKMREYDDWFFHGSTNPTVPAAKIEAIRLIGENAFTNAMKDPWIKQQIELGVRIFETNWTLYKKSSIPQLLIGTNIVTGYFRNTNDLYRVLTPQFPLKLPQGASNTATR